MDYRDFINTNMNDVITALNGSITPAPVNSELYRDFLNRKADDVITALNGSITPAPAGDELYRDFIERKFDDVISGIGGYVPPVTFPTLTGSIVTFNAQYALPLKSHTVDIDSVSGVSAINIGSDAKYAGFITWNQVVEDSGISGQSNNTDTAPLLRFQLRADGSPYTSYWSQNINEPTTIRKLLKATVGSSNLVIMHNGSTRNLRFYASNYGMIADHIYYLNMDFTGVDITTVGGVVWKDLQLIDLTVLFGEVKANEIYSQGEVSGIAYFKGLFPNDYYAYNSGALSTVSEVNGSTNSFFTIPIGQTVNEGKYNARTGVLEVTQPSAQTIQLPPCPIDVLEGVNNIWADTGDTTLKYPKFG